MTRGPVHSGPVLRARPWPLLSVLPGLGPGLACGWYRSPSPGCGRCAYFESLVFVLVMNCAVGRLIVGVAGQAQKIYQFLCVMEGAFISFTDMFYLPHQVLRVVCATSINLDDISVHVGPSGNVVDHWQHYSSRGSQLTHSTAIGRQSFAYSRR